MDWLQDPDQIIMTVMRLIIETWMQSLSNSRIPVQANLRNSRHKSTINRWVVAVLAAALVLIVAGLGPPRDSSATGNPAPSGGPGFDWRAWSPPSSIELGESFRLTFRLDDLTDSAEDGSISVSFPDLTRSGGSSSNYSSSQGSVRTTSYTSGTSKVKYYDRGDSIWNSRSSQVSARYLLVEPLEPNWPSNASRTLELEVTPNETGVFRVYYRFWLCVDNYSDCSRAPTGRDVDDTDQQGFDVGEFRIRVEESNSPPSVSAVSPLQSMTIDVGESVTFRARATDDDDNISQVDWYVNLSWESGGSLSPTGRIERSYTHRFSSAGTYRIEVEFTDTDGESDSVVWELSAANTNSPPSVSAVSPLQSMTIDVGDSVTFRARATDGDDNISQVNWYVNRSWESGGSLSPTGRIERSYTYRFPSAGTFRIEVEFTDTDGASDSAYWDVQVVQSPVVNSLGCSDTQVEIGEAVSCRPNLSGGSPTSYLWGSREGNPWAGTSRTFSTRWDSPGRKQIVFEACNNDGCGIGEHWVDVVQRTLNPPTIDRLGCSDSRVEVGETVSCSPRLSGGSPARYLWGSREGTPWSGTSRTFSTHWDSSGRKQIVFEACNNDGCGIGEHWVDVVQQVVPPPVIDRLDCSSANVNTGETVSCRGRLGGGIPSRYQWRAQGGSPSSGNSVRFSTHWDSTGTKRISLEVCNDEGCNLGEHSVVVAREIQATLRVASTGQIIPGSSITVVGSGFPIFRPLDYIRIGGRTTPKHGGYGTDQNGQFSITLTVPPLPPGTHELVAEVYGKVTRTSVRIVAAPSPNRAPVVSPVSPLASQRITVGSTQQFRAQASDADGDLTRVEWFVNGQSRSGKSLNSVGSARETLDYQIPSAGDYRLTVTFTDAEGASDSAEWRFEGVAVGQPPQPAPQVTNLGCSPLSVLVGETVTCKPHLSARDVSGYRWEAIGGESSWGTGTTFSTSWRTTGQKEIELEVCNADGECDSSSETITVEDVYYIGAQETYHGELSGTGDHQLLKVFVSAGRRLRLDLTEPPGVDFAFNVGLEDFEGEVARSWGLNSSSEPNSMEIRTPAAGWYKIRIASKRGRGRYEFTTRTDHAYLYLVVDDFSADRLSHIFLFRSNCGAAGGTAENYKIIESNTESRIVRFDLEEARHITRPDCFYDLPERGYWNLTIVRNVPWWQNADIRKIWLHDASVDFAYDDVRWVVSSGPERYAGVWFNVCIPDCNLSLQEKGVYELFRLLYLDDFEAVIAAESTGREKAEGGAWLGSNIIGIGYFAKFGKWLSKVGGPVSSKADDVWRWFRRVDDDAIEPALRNDWRRLGYQALGKATGEKISTLRISSMDSLLTPSEFAKVRIRIDGMSAGEKWVVIKDRIKNAQALTRNEAGLLGELQVAAAAKQLGLTLPTNWLRRGMGPASRIITDLDVLAKLPTEELIVFESKGHWRQFASGFQPRGSSLRFISNTEDYIISHIKARLTLLLAMTKRQGAKSLVIVAKGLPEKKLRDWMREQGIVYVRLAE